MGTPLSSLANIIAVGNEGELDNDFVGGIGTVPVSTIARIAAQSRAAIEESSKGHRVCASFALIKNSINLNVFRCGMSRAFAPNSIYS